MREEAALLKSHYAESSRIKDNLINSLQQSQAETWKSSSRRFRSTREYRDQKIENLSKRVSDLASRYRELSQCSQHSQSYQSGTKDSILAGLDY